MIPASQGVLKLRVASLEDLLDADGVADLVDEGPEEEELELEPVALAYGDWMLIMVRKME